MIHAGGRGPPRGANTIAVQALAAAFSGEKVIVDESSARMAVGESLATD